MSKYTMRVIIELIVYLYYKYFGILKCDLNYLLYVFYAEYLLLLLAITNKSQPVKTCVCSSRTNRWRLLKYIMITSKKPFTLQCWGKWRHDMWGKYVPALLRPYTEAYYMYDVLLSYLHYALQKQYQQKEREK